MKFEQFLSILVPKFGPKGTFDLARDARFKAIEKVLIKKGIVTQEVFDTIQEEAFEEMAVTMMKMPMPPVAPEKQPDR